MDPARPLKRKHLSAPDQADLDSLDTIFKRIKAAVPPTPYILSTPSLDPYRYHSQQQANAWMIGRLWHCNEEHLQYRTYLYREPCQDCFELQAGEDDELEPEPPRSQAANGKPPKKKPNLSAFKVKQANGTVTPGVKISSPSPAPAKAPSDQANGIKKAEKPGTQAEKAEPKSQRLWVHLPRYKCSANRHAPVLRTLHATSVMPVSPCETPLAPTRARGLHPRRRVRVRTRKATSRNLTPRIRHHTACPRCFHPYTNR